MCVCVCVCVFSSASLDWLSCDILHLYIRILIIYYSECSIMKVYLDTVNL